MWVILWREADDARHIDCPSVLSHRLLLSHTTYIPVISQNEMFKFAVLLLLSASSLKLGLADVDATARMRWGGQATSFWMRMKLVTRWWRLLQLSLINARGDRRRRLRWLHCHVCYAQGCSQMSTVIVLKKPRCITVVNCVFSHVSILAIRMTSSQPAHDCRNGITATRVWASEENKLAISHPNNICRWLLKFKFTVQPAEKIQFITRLSLKQSVGVTIMLL